MTKAKRQMQEDLKLIDLIIELVDARVPLSSRNPDIDQLGQNKSRLILLNKADLAGKELLRSLGIEGDYEGIGHCAIGYAAVPAPASAPRKGNYVYYVK